MELNMYWYLCGFKRDRATLQKENHTSNEKQKQSHKMKNWCCLLSCAYWKVASWVQPFSLRLIYVYDLFCFHRKLHVYWNIIPKEVPWPCKTRKWSLCSNSQQWKMYVVLVSYARRSHWVPVSVHESVWAIRDKVMVSLSWPGNKVELCSGANS